MRHLLRAHCRHSAKRSPTSTRLSCDHRGRSAPAARRKTSPPPRDGAASVQPARPTQGTISCSPGAGDGCSARSRSTSTLHNGVPLDQASRDSHIRRVVWAMLRLASSNPRRRSHPASRSLPGQSRELPRRPSNRRGGALWLLSAPLTPSLRGTKGASHGGDWFVPLNAVGGRGPNSRSGNVSVPKTSDPMPGSGRLRDGVV